MIPHVLEEGFLPLPGELEVLDALLVGLIDDFIVDVGDVHAELNVIAEVVPHDPPDHVVADVVSEWTGGYLAWPRWLWE